MRVVIDVGGTKTLLVAVDGSGRELGQLKFPTDTDYKKWRDNLIEQLHGWSKKLKQPIQGIAIAMPGVLDYERELVLSFGNLNWKSVGIAHELRDEFHVPVTLDNDGNFGALGEARRGAGKGYKTVLYVTVSTGIGTGVTVDGKIDPALAKSEGGHMHFRHDGKLIDWESFASGKAFYTKYGKMGKDTPQGDPSWDEWAEDLSLGFGSLMAVIQPDVIVIGGSMGEHFAKYSKQLIKVLEETKSDIVQMPDIKPAQEPNKAVINGGLEAISDSIS